MAFTFSQKLSKPYTNHLIKPFASTPILTANSKPLFTRLNSSYKFSTQKDDYKTSLNTTNEQTIKAQHVLAKNVGMNKFLQRVYNTTGLSLMGALSTAFVAMNTPFVLANVGVTAITGIVFTVGGLIGANMIKAKTVIEKENGIQILKSTNSPLRLGLFGLGIAGLGLSSTPLFMMAQAISPTIIPSALGITTAIFGGASLAAYAMPKDKMLGFGSILMGSLFGLIGMQLVGFLTALAIGPNPLSALLFSAQNYLGIGLFSMFIAYDTHASMKMYEAGEADHIGMAIQFMLDFWNILTRVVMIMSKRGE